ncbi:signal peptidase I [Enterococcus sp. AZ109]|uniref:signal peptidase I n=1 Tax=Enterococcus sp. AZ109 TaxID=2774634 RepID=UPI003F27B4A8
MNRIVNLLKNITIVFLLLILGFNLFSLYQRRMNDARFPMAFGYGYAVVASGSMEPALSLGDLVVVHQEDTYKVGDVITFIQEEDTRTTTHRIIAMDTEQFTTQGDANNVADAPIVADQIFGRVVFSLPWIGYLIQFVTTPLGILVVILLFLLMFYYDSKKMGKGVAE